MQQQPCGYEVLDQRDALQEAVVFLAFGFQALLDVGVATKRRAKNREALLGQQGPSRQPRQRRLPRLAERTCPAVLRQLRSRHASCDS